MCESPEQKFVIYEKMIEIEKALQELHNYSNLHDRSIFSTVGTFSRRFSDLTDKYQSINKKRIFSDECNYEQVV